MNIRTSKRCLLGIATLALISAPLAHAQASNSTPEMKAAFVKLQQGPDALRRYVERTKPIYMLDVNEVIGAYEATQLATSAPTLVADAAIRR